MHFKYNTPGTVVQFVAKGDDGWLIAWIKSGFFFVKRAVSAMLIVGS